MKCEICKKEIKEDEEFTVVEITGAFNEFSFNLCKECDSDYNKFNLLQTYMFL